MQQKVMAAQGRIVNILYLVINDLLDLPILYLSRFITHNKGGYYRLLQAVRDGGEDNAKEWEEWILFILKGVEETSIETTAMIKAISKMMADYKAVLKSLFGTTYKHELLNYLFFHPYTKIEFVCHDMGVQRKTGAKYLDMIVGDGLLNKIKIGRENYYINKRLFELFLNHSEAENTDDQLTSFARNDMYPKMQ